MDESLLTSTRAFWDANPCGVHDGYEAQCIQRYAMEPWLPPLLAAIAERHASILEVGCGQGVDSIELCSAMAAGGRYAGIDYSPRSVEAAAATAARLSARLAVTPEYRVGNAEALEFADSSFGAVYSMGVLHHTADEHRAVREIHRVLRPGGKAYVCLYRKPSPKVAVAKGLRALQAAADALLGTDRCIYEIIRRRASSNRQFGTMFHECFGVPYMKWYGRHGIEALFADFATVSLTPYGANLGRLNPTSRPTTLGYFWVVEATRQA